MAKARELKSGMWNVQVLDYKDANGKWHYRSITEPTKELAELKAKQFSFTRKSKKELATRNAERDKYLHYLISDDIKREEARYNVPLGKKRLKRVTLKNITKDIEKELENIDDMDGFYFEQYCTNLINLCGAFSGGNAIKTKDIHDNGADIIIQCFDGSTIVVQCKRFQGNIGMKAIQEIHTSKQHYGANKAAVLTNSFFTEAAIELAKETDVTLLDRNSLIKLIQLKDKNMSRLNNQWEAFLNDLSE